jgi:hypothetical protein
MATSYIALLEASDPHSLAECPNPNVKVTLVQGGLVRMVGEYDDLMQVLTQFVGMGEAEADTFIAELV